MNEKQGGKPFWGTCFREMAKRSVAVIYERKQQKQEMIFAKNMREQEKQGHGFVGSDSVHAGWRLPAVSPVWIFTQDDFSVLRLGSWAWNFTIALGNLNWKTKSRLAKGFSITFVVFFVNTMTSSKPATLSLNPFYSWFVWTVFRIPLFMIPFSHTTASSFI